MSTRTVRIIRSAVAAQVDKILGGRKSPAGPVGISFDTLEPRTMMSRVPGIDVSQFQGTINWTSVRAAGKEFAFQRATIGNGTADTKLTANMAGGAAAGVLMGAYHHAQPDATAGDAVAEANYFLATAGSYMTAGWMRPILVVEEGSGLGATALSQWVNDFEQTVKTATGVDPVIYCNTNYASNFFNSSVATHDLWIANWSTSYGDPNVDGSPPSGVWAGGTWDFWQHSSTGVVSGITGNVDLDVFQGDRAALESQFLISPGAGAFQLSVNFGPYESAVPSGYINFANQTYGSVLGYTMGWTSTGTQVLSRTGGSAPDNRYRTYAMPVTTTGGVTTARSFEVGVPNGSYRVRIVAGSPDQVGSTYKFTVEGVMAINGVSHTGTEFLSSVVTVNVTDGKLTIGSDATAPNSRLAFLDIESAPRASAPPAAPSAVEATPASPTAVDVHWKDNADNEGRDPSTFVTSTLGQVNEGYLIERRDWNGTGWSSWAQRGYARGNAESYTDTGLTGGGQYQYRVTAVNAVGPSNAAEGSAVTTPLVSSQQSYSPTGEPWPVPTFIQAEDYDRGGPGVGFSDGSAGNTGGFYRSDGMDVGRIINSTTGAPLSPRQYRVGWFRPGDWVAYTVNVPVAGTYSMQFRVSAPNSGAKFHASAIVGGVETNLAASMGGQWDLPATGNYNTFRTITQTVQLQKGVQVIRVYADTAMVNDPGVMDFDWMRIAPPGVVLPPSIGGATTVESGATYTLDLRSGDPARTDAMVWVVDWGDGSPAETFEGVSAATHIFASGVRTSTITATVTGPGGPFTDPSPVAITVIPWKPVGLVSTARTSTSVSLAWLDSDDLESGFTVERSTDGVTFSAIGTTAANVTQFTDSSAAPGTLYYYRVKATAGSYSSAESLTLPVRTVSPASISGGATSVEGAAYSLALSGPTGTTGWTIDWGDGVVEDIASSPSSVSHVYVDDAPRYAIQAIARTASASYVTDPIEVRVANAIRSVTATGDSTVTENTPYTLHLSSTDPGRDAVIRWIIDWGDGSTAETFEGDLSEVQHVYFGVGAEYTIVATAIDEDSAVSSSPLTVTVESPYQMFSMMMGPALLLDGDSGGEVRLPIDGTLDGWTPIERGSTETDLIRGQGGNIVLREGGAFEVGIARAITFGTSVSTLVIDYSNLSFDRTSVGQIRDAFEIALVDEDGKPVTGTFAIGRDGLFNLTDGMGASMASGTTLGGATSSGGTVSVDISSLAGRTVRVIVRLVNNDQDNNTTVTIVGHESNGAPVVTMPTQFTGNEGSPVTVSASFTDEAGDAHTALIDWGDGTVTPGTINETTHAVTGSHIYADNGTYAVKVTVSDGTAEGNATSSAVVSNVNPSATAGIRFATVTQGGATQLAAVISGSFTDPGFTAARTSETFTVEINWGDGSPVQRVPASVVQGSPGVLTTGTFTGSHVYGYGQTYTATVTVRDDDNGTAVVTLAPFRVIAITVVSNINMNNPKDNGVTEVKIHKDAVDVSLIKQDTLRFGPAGAPLAGANPLPSGGDKTWMTHYPTQQTGFRPGDTLAFLSGQLTDGTYFVGMDVMKQPVKGPDSRTDNVVTGTAATKFFVADASADNTYRYASSGAAGGYYAMDNQMTDARGIAANAAGDRLWTIGSTGLVQVSDAKGTILGSWYAVGTRQPTGITTDGSTFWVVDAQTRRIYRYDGAGGMWVGHAVSNASFALNVNNANPSDVVTDGKTIWVTDDVADAVFVYNVADGAYLGRWQLDLRNSGASGITMAPGGTSLWVSDRGTRTVYRYDNATGVRSGSLAAAATFALQINDKQPEGIADPVPATPALSSSGGGYAVPGKGTFYDVTSSFNFTYLQTSLNDANQRLFAGLSIARKAGDQTFMRNRMLLVVRGISDPAVMLADADGHTADGSPYYDLTADFAPGANGVIGGSLKVEALLRFINSGGNRFQYTLQLLSGGNTAPHFTSDPMAHEQGQAYPVDLSDGSRALEVVVKNGNSLSYALAGVDPENDAITYQLLSGAPGMSIGTVNGAPVLLWTPGAAGTYTVRLRAVDSFGAFDPANDQVFIVRAVAGVQNRPPRFTTDPVLIAYAGETYTYDANGFDPDGDTLAFSYLPDTDQAKRPGGNFGIVTASGVVSWTPTYADIGKRFTVRLRVSDQQSPALYSDQEYEIEVRRSANPVIPGTPDLTVSDVDTDGVAYDPQRLRAEGVVTAKVSNAGAGSVNAPFEVLFFEDLDFNQQYTPNVDNVLGRARVEQPIMPGETISVAAAITGSVQFAGGHIWAFVDSGGVIAESNENNNTDRSERDCKVTPVVGQFDPVPEHAFTSSGVVMSSAVADLDGDGVPEIVYSNFDNFNADSGSLTIVNGATGVVEWSGGSIMPLSEVAIGDLDLDGTLEIVGNGGGYLEVFYQVSAGQWNSTAATTGYNGSSLMVALALANVDADPYPEIIVGSDVFEHDLTKKAQPNLPQDWSSSGTNGWGPISVVADLDMDGTPEIVTGNGAIHADGTVVWRNTNIADGFPGVADFDHDGLPEVVTVSYGTVYMLNGQTGAVIWERDFPVQGGTNLGPELGGAPTIADVDGDGHLEIGVAGSSQYMLLRDDGTVGWTYTTQDYTSGATGSSVFDFEGDGKVEIVYGDELYLRIFAVPADPASTVLDVKWSQRRPSGTAFEMPIIADVDADGNAELIVVANQSWALGTGAEDELGDGLYVFGDRNDTWVPTRKIWNQNSYHVTNVNDDGTIPVVEQPSWLASNTYRLNTIPDPNFDPTDAPDLLPSYIRVEGVSTGTKYTVRVGNNGNFFAPAHIKVTFYNGDPNAAGVAIGSAYTAGQLDPGHYEDVSITVTGAPVGDVWVVVDDDNKVRECEEDNNSYSLLQGTAPLAPNLPPQITSTPVTSVFEGGNYVYQVVATDPNQQQLLYQLVTRPAGMTIDPVTGKIEWQPRQTDVGTTSVYVRVSDGRGGTDVQRFDLKVLTTNLPPRITSTPTGPAAVDKPYTYQATAEDGNGNVLTWRVDPASAALGVTIDANGLLTWTPHGLGEFPIQIIVSDGRGGVDRQTFWLPVVNDNTPPHIQSAPEGPIFAGETWNYQLVVSDIEDGTNLPANPALHFSLDDAAAQLGMTIDDTGLITWTPAFTGTFVATVTVRDSGGATASQTITLPVGYRPAVSRPAEITTDPTGPALVGHEWRYPVKASDPDGDPVTLSLVTLTDATGAAIPTDQYTVTQPKAGQMLISWTPVAGVVGPAHVKITVVDNHSAGESQEFDLPVLQVEPPNTPPQITSTPPIPAGGGQKYVYVVRAKDLEDDAVTFSVGGAQPEDLIVTPIDHNTASIEWTNPPAGAQKDFTVRATDARGGWSEQRVVVTIGSGTGTGSADTPPTITSTPTYVVVAGQHYRYQVTATDPDASPGAKITYSVSAPSRPGLAINPDTGLIDWTTAPSDIGEFDVMVTASQGGGSTSQLFHVRVTDPTSANHEPVIQPAGAPLTAMIGRTFFYRVTATDPDANDVLSYAIMNGSDPMTQINGLSINSQGVISWTPAADAVSQTIVVRVTDSAGAYDEQVFAIGVATDAAPTASIGVSPQAPAAGSEVGFFVRAQDDVGIASRTVTVTAPWLTQPVKLEVGPDGWAYYDLPAGVAGQTLTATATVRDTAGNQVVTPGLQVAIAVGVASPVVSLDGVGNGIVFSQATALTGLVTDPDDDLVYYAVTATPVNGGTPITLLSQGTLNGTTAIEGVDGTIVTIDPSLLANGSYLFRVYAQDSGGRDRSVSFVGEVDSQTKVGDFSLNFTDVSTNVGPIPITITRTYDSSRAGQNGDFGYGWSMSVSKGTLNVDVPNGEDPVIGSGWLRAYQYGTRITVTLPDGSTRGFTTVLIPDRSGDYGAGAFLGLANFYLVAFLPDEDSRDTRLELASGQLKNLMVDAGSGLPQNLGLPDALTENGFISTLVYYDEETGELREPSAGGGLPWNPATHGINFHLEQLDGTSYTFDSQTGELLTMGDRQGHSIYYSDNGDTIEARSGSTVYASVHITRTGSRVDSITWSNANPNGATVTDSVSYTYDPVTGDLATFTDQSGAVTSYIYNRNYQQNITSGLWEDVGTLNRPHFLTRIVDETRDVPTLTAVFDPVTGRLSKLVDASGASAGIGYSLDGSQYGLPAGQTIQVTTDAYNYKTEFVRDVQGNVVRQIQQTGTSTYLVVVNQYDAQGNQTAQSKPHQVDELVDGANARYTWQPDANTGFASRTVYGDPSNPTLPTETTDAMGHKTTYKYDSRGNLLESRDDQGNVTVNTYDSNGTMTQSVDADGNVSTYGYINGNLTSLTQKGPDGVERPVLSANFNVFGQMQSFTDATNHTVSVEYDSRGRLTAKSFVDDNGKTVRQETVFDKNGRVTDVRLYVDGQLVSGTTSTLDAGGRVLTSTDPFSRMTTYRYDAVGRIVEMRVPAKDAVGNNVTVIARTAYDANGRVVAVTDPYVEGVTPAADIRVTQTFYDGAGRITGTRRLAGVGIDLAYVSGGDATPGHLGGVFASSFAYNANSNTYGGVPAANVTLSSTAAHYDDEGRVDWTQSETGLKTYTHYDDAGNVDRTWVDMDLDGNSTLEHSETKYEYDSLGNQTRMTDPAGRVTDFVYDDQGRVIRTISRGVVAPGVTPGSPQDDLTDDITTVTVYDDQGREAADIDALGRRTDYEYDAVGRLIAVTLPAIDPDGLLTGTVDARRPRYEYHYDAQGRKTLVVANAYVDATGTKVSYVTRDASGAQTTTTRDRAADPSMWSTTQGSVTAYTYDGGGRQLTRTLPLGVQTTGNTTDFVESMVYDTTNGPTQGQLKYQVDFSGRVTAYDYDNTATGGGRVKAVRYYNTLAAYNADTAGTQAVRTITSTYDAFGRVAQVNDSDFSTPTVYAYDADGRVTKIDSAQGTLHYAYDPIGQKIATWTGAGNTLADARTMATTLTEYVYDGLGRLVTTKAVRRFGQNIDIDPNAANAQPETTTTVFAADGRIDYELAPGPNGTVTTDHAYDSQGRPQAIDHFVDADGDRAYDAGEVLLGSYHYTYFADGNRASETDNDGAGHTTTKSFAYDGNGRLVRESFDGFDDQGAALKYVDTFTYDVSGNRITTAHDDQTPGGTGSAGADSVTTSVYDGNDRVLTEAKDVGGTANTADDTFTAYGYAGTDQTTKTIHQGLTAAGTVTETTTFTYDTAGRMTGASVAANGTTTSVTYAYDANGFRVERTEGGVRTVYLVDPANGTGYAQVIEEGVDANGNHKLDAADVQKAYTLGAQVLAQATATQVLHLLTDAQGSTRAVLNVGSPILDSSAILQRYAYRAYGSDLGLPATPLTSIRYAGQMLDPLTGLSFNRARWYDPSRGRFTQLDPWSGDMRDPLSLNKYLYGNGNPVNRTDPTGFESLAELMVTMTIGEGNDAVQNGVKATRAAIQTAKMVVRFTFLAMEVEILKLSFSDEISGGVAAGAFSFGYYLYEWRGFEDRMKNVKEAAKVVRYEPRLVGYLTKLPKGIALLQQHADQLKARKTNFLSVASKGEIEHIVLMPLTGRRYTDDKLASAIVATLDIAKLIQVMTNGEIKDAESALIDVIKDLSPVKTPGLTWHHSEVMGVMEQIGTENNASENHKGAAAFWGWIHGLSPYPK